MKLIIAIHQPLWSITPIAWPYLLTLWIYLDITSTSTFRLGITAEIVLFFHFKVHFENRGFTHILYPTIYLPTYSAESPHMQKYTCTSSWTFAIIFWQEIIPINNSFVMFVPLLIEILFTVRWFLTKIKFPLDL